MPIIRIFDLGVIVIIFILEISVNAVYAAVGSENNDGSIISNNNINSNHNSISNSSNNTTSASLTKGDNYAIKVGAGNHSVSITQYFPPYVEIKTGDSITWYNGVDVPNPHTVTFIRDLDNIEKIGLPFLVPNNTKFTPVLSNLGEPLEEMTDNGTRAVMMLNARALTPTVITSDDQVIHLKRDAVYVYHGDEKFINSGPLLSLNTKQNFDYSYSGSFTVVFNKPGFFEYSCLFHPWMVGKILVK